MALAVSTDADGEDDFTHESDGAGYSQIPADHLSDSSERSYGPSDGLTYEAPDFVSSPEDLVAAMTHNNGRSVAHNGGVPSLQNGRSGYGTGNEALVHYRNERDVGGMDNRAAPHNSGSHIGVPHSNGIHDLHMDYMQNHANNNHDSLHNGHVVHIDGLEIHVYGQVAALQLSAPQQHANTGYDEDEDDDDHDENERQHEEDIAMLRAKEEEEARRSAPLPPERCQAIRNAMQSISLGGYRPEWADKIPEEQWLNRLRMK